MEHIIKDIVDIQYDLKQLIGRADTYRQDAERGINVNHTSTETGWTKQDKINSLFDYLTDAVHDIDRMRDDMKQLQEHLTNLVDSVEYESVRQKALGNSSEA